MKRTFKLTLLAALFLTATVAEGGVWHKKVDEARKAAQQKRQLIFVDLFAEWCGWCHRFDREIVPSEAFQNATRDMVLLRVDTEDRGEGTELARRYGITRLPTFLVLTPEMTVAGVIQGYAPAAEFATLLQKKLGEYEKLKKDLKREASLEPQERLRLATELVARHDFAEARKRLERLAADAKLPAGVRDEARYMIAVAQASEGKRDEALASVGKLLERTSSGEAAQKAVLLRARIYVDQKNYPAALQEYRSFKTKWPSSPHMQTVDFYIPQLESAIARNRGR